MPQRQPQAVTSGLLSAMAVGSSMLAIAGLAIGSATNSESLRALSALATTIAALTWASALAIVGRTFSRRSRNAEAVDFDAVRIRRGLPKPAFVSLITLSVIAAGCIVAATRSTGMDALAWGLATIALGSGIGWLRFYGYRQRFTADDAPESAESSDIEGWLQVSRNATTDAMTRLQVTQVGLFVGAAAATQVGAGASSVPIYVALGFALLFTGVNIGISHGWARLVSCLAIAVTALALIVLNLSTADSISLSNGALTGALLAWSCVLCTAAGFGVPTSNAIGASLAIAAGACIVTILLWHYLLTPASTGREEFHGVGIEQANFDWILIPAAALCVAHVTSTLTATLGSLSSTYDDIATRAWRNLNTATARIAHDAAIFEASRMVHDTLINTLGAIRTQRIEPARLQQRLVDDLALLDAETGRRTPTQANDTALAHQVLQRAFERARMLGVSVEYTYSEDAQSLRLDQAARDAVFGSTLEALTNISKYSPDSAALAWLGPSTEGTMCLQISSRYRTMSFRPEYDGGMSKSIVGRCDRAGLPVTITADSGRLLIQIALVNPMTTTPANPAASALQAGAQSAAAATTAEETPFAANAYIRDATLAATRSVSFWPIGYCILLSAAWATYYDLGWWLLGAVVSVASALTVINTKATGLNYRGLMSATTIAVTLVIMWQLAGPQQFADSGVLGPLGLSYVGAAVIVVTNLFTDSPKREAIWVVVGYVGGCVIASGVFLAQGEAITLPIAAGLGMIAFAVPLTFTSHWLRRGALRASAVAAQMGERETSERRVASNRIAREQLIEAAVGNYREFIEDMATGKVPLDSHQVLEEVASVERALRNFVQVGSTPGPVSDELLATFAKAQHARIEADVIAFDIASTFDVSEPQLVGLVSQCLIDAGSPGDTLVISTYREVDTIGITFVISRFVPRPSELAELGDGTAEWLAGDLQTFVDLQLPYSSPRASATPSSGA